MHLNLNLQHEMFPNMHHKRTQTVQYPSQAEDMLMSIIKSSSIHSSTPAARLPPCSGAGRRRPDSTPRRSCCKSPSQPFPAPASDWSPTSCTSRRGTPPRPCRRRRHVRSGITGIGYKTFVSLAECVEGKLTAGSLAAVIWGKQNVIAKADGFDSASDIEAHLQRVVDVYSLGRVYDDKSNIVNMNGERVSEASHQTIRHDRAGKGERNS